MMPAIFPSLISTNGRLARRMGAYVILTSTVIALFTTAIQIYTEYKRDVRTVHAGLEQIEKTHLTNIAARIWVLDSNELRTTLDNLLSISSIKYIAVYENNDLLMTAGSIIVDDAISKEYPLNYTHNNSTILIGKLIVKASLKEAYQHIIDRSIVVLASNAVKTFIVAGFILLIFYRLVARHLEKITEFAEQLNITNLDNSFEFDRHKNPSNRLDELDLLKTSLHKMQHRLLSAIQDREDSQAQVNLILDSTAEAIYGINTDGDCTFINQACLDMLRYDDNTELLGRNMHDLIHHSHADKSHYPIDDCPIFRAYKQVTPTHSDAEVFWRKDGSHFSTEYWSHPIVREGECVGAVVNFLDISSRLETLNALQDREQSLTITLNSMIDAVITTGHTGTILSFNQAAESLFGYKAKEIIGKNVNLLVPEQFKTEHDKYIKDYLTTGESKIIGEGREVQGKRKSGEEFPMRLVVAELSKGKTDDRSFIASCIDLTQLKMQEDQLRRSQKMDALGKLTGGISHDYNNMLGVIIGFADLLEQELEDQPNLRYYAHQIQHAGKRGAKLTKKLLSFSRSKPADEDIHDINELLLGEKHLLEKSLTARIKLTYHLSDGIWPVLLDSDDLGDAMLNLSINAMHAMNSGGDLSIETKKETLSSHESELLNIPPGDYVRLNVSDTGEGIDPAAKDKIFDPFFTTKGEYGTGLGLSQVYGFIDRCGGAIKVQSEQGQGTSISMYFPRNLQGNGRNRKTPEQDPSNLTGRETILVVDDEPALVNLTQAVLRQQGYNILTANCAKQALEVLESHSVDVLLSDVIMPEMDGYELAAIVQQKYPNVKIQLASGFTGELHENKTVDAMHKNLLQKPYNAQTLLIKIRDLLA